MSLNVSAAVRAGLVPAFGEALGHFAFQAGGKPIKPLRMLCKKSSWKSVACNKSHAAMLRR